MDPNETWQQLAEAFKAKDLKQLLELARALLDWLRKDGFPPTVTGVREFDVMVAKQTCTQFVYYPMPHMAVFPFSMPDDMLIPRAEWARAMAPPPVRTVGGFGPVMPYSRDDS